MAIVRMEEMKAAKEKLRRRLLRARQGLPKNDRSIKDEQIFERLKPLINWDNISSVHVYESIDSLAEISTSEFIKYLRTSFPDVKIFIPKQLNGEWYDVDDQGNFLADRSCDVIIVPVLGFDNSLNRLGYGGGYYDRLLSKQTNAWTIGLGYEAGHVEKVPVEQHDIKVKCVLTEKQAYIGV